MKMMKKLKFQLFVCSIFLQFLPSIQDRYVFPIMLFEDEATDSKIEGERRRTKEVTSDETSTFETTTSQSETTTAENPNSCNENPITDLETTEVTDTRIFIRWKVNSAAVENCKLEGYNVTWVADVLWDEGRRSWGFDFTNQTEYVMTDLIPHSNYTYCITAVGKFTNEDSEENCCHNVTLVGKPGPPLNMKVKPVSSSELELEWSEPPDRNAPILGPYSVTWSLRSGGQTLSTKVRNTYFVIRNLSPCGKYFVGVSATSSAGAGEPATEVATTLTAAPPAPNNLKCKPGGPSTIHVSWTTPDTLCSVKEYALEVTGKVLWNSSEEHFNECTTHSDYTLQDLTPYSTYDVAVRGVTEAGQGASVKCNATTEEDAPESCMNLSVVEASITKKTFQIEWKPPINVNGKLKGFEVTYNGTTDYVASSNASRYTYEIEYLRPKSFYRVFLKAQTGGGLGDPATTEATTLNSAAGWIAGGALLCSILVVALAVAGYVNRERLRQTVRRAYPTFDHREISELSLTPVPLYRLSAEIRRLEGGQLGVEFNAMAEASHRGSTSEANMAQNHDKNRYANVLPYDETRVGLDFGGSSYINANYVDSFSRSKFFIAAQGPKVNTLRDFWSLVWQENVDIIVMLTLCVEDGKEKCVQYWPDASAFGSEVGALSIHCFSEEATSLFIVRNFELTNRQNNKKKLAKQFQFTAWSDFGVPEKEDDLLKIVQAVKQNLERNRDQNKILVHCSAGVGRTGTFIGLWNLTEEIDSGMRTVNICQEVLNMRKQRVAMVQSQEQYLYLYKCVNAYFENQQKWQIRTHNFRHGNTNSQDQGADRGSLYGNRFSENQKPKEFEGNLI